MYHCVMVNTKQDAAALPLGPQPLPEVVRHRVITDPAAIKAVSDPLRLRIMRLMQKGAHEQPRTFTVKQLAAELDEPPTKLYRHVKALLKVELIQIAEVRLVGGIVEQRYRVAQAGFVVNPQAGDGIDSDIVGVAAAAIDEFLHRYLEDVRSGRTFVHDEDARAHPPHVGNAGLVASVRLPQGKAAEFAQRLKALADEFAASEHDENGVEANMLMLFYATE